MTDEQNSAQRLALDSMTFGKSCTRCSIYYLTTNRTEQLCPWCRRNQAGLEQELATELPDEPYFEGI
jgi:hypothetical protein